MFNRFHYHIALLHGALLLCLNSVAYADDIEDATQMFKQGQHGLALSKVNGYLVQKPKDAQARFLKGLILTEQGQTTDAIKMFSALTEDYPELPEPYNNLAVLFAGQGQYDKAKLALEMAIRTHPSYATAHENLGDIYAKMASQAYGRALQLDRDNAATQTKLAMIQDLFGDAKRAKELPILDSPAQDKIAATTIITTKNELEPTPPNATTSPAPAVSPSSQAISQKNEVLNTVAAWAAAWSSRNIKKYLSFYAVDFKTPDGLSRADWEASRTERIHTPKSIRVNIINAKVQFSDNGHATVKFRQSYRSSHLRSLGNKTLLMAKSDGKWQILEERAK